MIAPVNNKDWLKGSQGKQEGGSQPSKAKKQTGVVRSSFLVAKKKLLLWLVGNNARETPNLLTHVN